MPLERKRKQAGVLPQLSASSPGPFTNRKTAGNLPKQLLTKFPQLDDDRTMEAELILEELVVGRKFLGILSNEEIVD